MSDEQTCRTCKRSTTRRIFELGKCSESGTLDCLKAALTAAEQTAAAERARAERAEAEGLRVATDLTCAKADLLDIRAALGAAEDTPPSLLAGMVRNLLRNDIAHGTRADELERRIAELQVENERLRRCLSGQLPAEPPKLVGAAPLGCLACYSTNQRNAELQGELERVAALFERRAKESDQQALVASEADDPVTEAHCDGMSMAYDIAMKYLRRMTHPAPSAPAEQSAPVCTGLTARWCPRHGDCTCPQDGDLDRDNCPLHTASSNHAEPAEQSAPGGAAGVDCPECDGTGQTVEQDEENFDAAHDVVSDCDACNGTGRGEGDT